MRIFTICFLLLLANPFITRSQDGDAPYLKNPTLPNFSILRDDSTSWFSSKDVRTGVPVIIMLFSPECDHCREQTEILTRNMEKLGKTEIVMSTFQPLYKMRDFSRQYNLSRYANVHVGRDVKYFFGPFYRIRYSPFIAIYDKERNLVKVYEGGAKIDKILEAIR